MKSLKRKGAHPSEYLIRRGRPLGLPLIMRLHVRFKGEAPLNPVPQHTLVRQWGIDTTQSSRHIVIRQSMSSASCSLIASIAYLWPPSSWCLSVPRPQFVATDHSTGWSQSSRGSEEQGLGGRSSSLQMMQYAGAGWIRWRERGWTYLYL